MFYPFCCNSRKSKTDEIQANQSRGVQSWARHSLVERSCLSRVGAAVVAGVLIFGSGNSHAAGLPDPGAALPDLDFSRPNNDGGWSGMYMGASLGYGFGETSVIGNGGDLNIDTDGAFASLYLGRNWQFENFVVGLEGEWGGGNMSGNADNPATSFDADLNWMAAIRARAGILLGQSLLIYATGGYAWADIDVRATGAGGFNISENFSGYQVGGGAEFRFSPKWSLRFDYTYTDLEDVNISTAGVSTNFDPDFHLIRTGLTMHF